MLERTGRAIVYPMVVLFAAWLAGGCGGGNSAAGSPAPGQTGTVVLEVNWPERAEIESQLVPERSNFIWVQITDVATDADRVHGVLVRPNRAPWVTEVRYEGVYISDRAQLTATAFPVDPTASPDAVAQASGSMHIVIPAGGTAYPVGGAPGDPIELSMNSTVDHVTVIGASEAQDSGGPLEMDLGETLQLIATAHDVDGNTVLVPDFEWGGSNANALVDTQGLVTARRAGQTEITATEIESGVAGSLTVEVQPSVFADRDDAVYSPAGSVPVGSAASWGDRYAMETTPGGQGDIGIFDRQTDELLMEVAALPEGPANDLKGLAWSPDGAHLAVMYHGGMRPGITIYDAATGAMELRVAIDAPYHYMVFSDSGDALLVWRTGAAVITIAVVTSGGVPVTISGIEGGCE